MTSEYVVSLTSPVTGCIGVDTVNVSVVNCKNNNETSSNVLVKGKSVNVFAYPNPGIGEYMIDYFSCISENVNVSLYNLIGDKIYEHPYKTENNNLHFTLNIENIPDGIYLLTVQSETKKETLKLIKSNK